MSLGFFIFNCLYNGILLIEIFADPDPDISDTVLPTVIIKDANGNIVFADLTDNYRVRPEPETFLKVIDSIT